MEEVKTSAVKTSVEFFKGVIRFIFRRYTKPSYIRNKFNENDKGVWTSWSSHYFCNNCKSLDSFDGAYITCRECGHDHGEFVAVKYFGTKIKNSKYMVRKRGDEYEFAM